MREVIQARVEEWAANYAGPPFHSALMDPPYELGFMGRSWDRSGVSFRPETWAALAAHLHPGAFILAFGGCRTYHRMATAMEDAGLTIHPALCWAFGSGFPKATRLDSQVDRDAGEEQPVVGTYHTPEGRDYTQEANGCKPRFNDLYRGGLGGEPRQIRGAVTPLARTWAGHRYGGQALKPAVEFIAVAQKPYAGRPVDSITRTGAGAYNIEGARIGTGESLNGGGYAAQSRGRHDGAENWRFRNGAAGPYEQPAGRWPANLLLDEETARQLDQQSGWSQSPGSVTRGACRNQAFGMKRQEAVPCPADTGGASRFFFQSDWLAERLEAEHPLYYCAKAGRTERDAGLEGLPLRKGGVRSENSGQHITRRNGDDPGPVRNPHPCAKPIRLCRYLATLLLPPAAYAPRRLLLPFSGSGSEMIGAVLAGWEEILGIEAEAEYCEIARRRLEWWQGNVGLFEQITAAEPETGEVQGSLFAGELT